jgi:dienelactone hydrolase
MTRIHMKRIHLLFLNTVTILSTLNVVSAQEKTSFKMDPVSEETFQIILQSYSYDKEMPLDVRVVEKTKMNNCIREKFVFNGVRDSRVPGYLAIPSKGMKPYPCIILLHGFTGNKDEWWQDDSFYGGGLVTKAFLDEGYAVLALDAQYHGERRLNNDYEQPSAILDRGWYSRSVEMIIQSVTEYRRAVDFLETRPEIDMARIGVHGYSMGGMMTFLLTATEPRVKVSVSCVTWNWDNPDKKYSLIAPYNFARALVNRPFLMMMGRSDKNLPVEAAERLYSLLKGRSTNLIFYDSGHRLPNEYINESLQWFRRFL